MGQEQSGEGVTQSETSLGGTMTCRNMDTGEVKEVTIDENTTIADFRRMIEGDQVNPEYEKYRQLERSTPHGHGWVATKGTSLEGPASPRDAKTPRSFPSCFATCARHVLMKNARNTANEKRPFYCHLDVTRDHNFDLNAVNNATNKINTSTRRVVQKDARGVPGVTRRLTFATLGSTQV